MDRVLIIILMMLTVVVCRAEDGGSGTADSIPHLNVNLNNPKLGVVKKTVRGFSAIDTNYVEPQRFWAGGARSLCKNSFSVRRYIHDLR